MSRPAKPASSVADLRRMTARDILKRPLITEKTMGLTPDNKYTFEVDRRANKVEIRNAVQEIFDVDVIKVTTTRTNPKKRRRGKDMGFTQEKKKAVITLKEGQQIQVGGTPLFEV